jgi:hypothetical protein
LGFFGNHTSVVDADVKLQAFTKKDEATEDIMPGMDGLRALVCEDPNKIEAY